MQTDTSRLRPLPRFTLKPDCNLIIIVVPGIDTDPVPSWRKGSILTSLLAISQDSAFHNPYVAWWDHRLPRSRLLSYQHQHESADALRREIYRVLSGLSSKQCPIIFVGHSIGGLLVKEAISSWDQAANRNEASLCIAGAIFLGTPHTWYVARAFHFCTLASRALLNQKYSDNETHYASPMADMCRVFESMHISSFSIFEIEKTKLKTFKEDFLVDKELARVGFEDKLWSMKSTHKQLCHGNVTKEMHDGLEQFLKTTIEAQLARIESPGTKKSSASTRSRPSLRTAESRFEMSFVDSPIESSNLTSDSSGIPGDAMPKRSHSSHDSALQRITGTMYNIPQMSDQSIPRDDVLHPVEKVLFNSNPWQDPTKYSEDVRAFALCGHSGMGKSLSALQFIYKHRNRYDNIFWVSAENPSKLFSAFSQIAVKLSPLEDSKHPRDRFESQKKALHWFEYGCLRVPEQSTVPWLLVFDNVERVEHLEGFWPSKGGGDILVTTQRSLVDLNSFSSMFGVEILPFGRDVALQFLLNLSSEQVKDPLEVAKATAVAEILGGMPLALMALSSLITQHKLDPELLLKAAGRRDTLDSAPMRSDLSGESLQSLLVVVEPLLEKLTVSKSLMDFICLLDSDGAHEWILIDSSNSRAFDGFPIDEKAYYAAKQELVKSNLITEVKVSDINGIAAPRMIRKVVRQRMGSARFQAVFEATVEMLWQLWPRMNLEDRHNIRRWGTSDALMRHVRCLLDVSPIELELKYRPSMLFARLLNNAAWSLYEQGDYEDARSFAEQAREISDNLEDDETSLGSYELPELQSQVYYTLGAIAQITHQRSESLKYHTKMLVLRKDLKSKNRRGDEFLAHAYNEIGNDFMSDDDYEIAIGFYRRSIRIYEKLNNVKPSTLALPRVNLGLAYWLQRDFEKALEIVQQALEQQEQEMRGPDDGITMKTGRLLFAMGNITYDLERYDESLRYHERAFNQFRVTIGRGHNRSCDVLWRLADHYERRKEYERALVAVNDALENLWNRPLFEREKARLLFKKANIMKKTREYSQPMHYQPLLDAAYDIYRRSQSEEKSISDLNEEDFNELIMFWSR